MRRIARSSMVSVGLAVAAGPILWATAPPATSASMSPIHYAYTGTVASYTVPSDGSVCSVTLSLAGADGGDGRGGFTESGGIGGSGGRITATLDVEPGQILVISVGGAGHDGGIVAGDGTPGDGAGGSGGGGAGGQGEIVSAGGGGASFARYSTQVDTVSLAAGGGGGGGFSQGPGGDGGVGQAAGTDGGLSGTGAWGMGGGGGTLTAGGSGGAAGNADGNATPGADAPSPLFYDGGDGGTTTDPLAGGGGGGGGGWHGGGGGGGASDSSTGGGGGGGSSGAITGTTGVGPGTQAQDGAGNGSATLTPIAGHCPSTTTTTLATTTTAGVQAVAATPEFTG
jgi:hypothetical protein